MARILKDWRAWICAAVLLFVLIIGVFAPLIATKAPNALQGTKLLPPGKEFLLGTDIYSRDIFSRLCYGARVSLIISLGSVALAMVAGTTLGIVGGYFRGSLWETFIMRAIDFLLSFPTLVLAILVVAFVGAEIHVLVIVIGVVYIPTFARIAYTSTRSVHEMAFVEAASAMGCSTFRILARAILPNIVAPLLVQASLRIGNAILVEAGLSFLGLGAPPPAVSWGQMIREAIRFLNLSYLPLLWPSLLISLTVLATNIFGDVLRDNLDPRLKGRH